MEISYGQDEHHKFDFYPAQPATSARPLIVFVHGGAWRSEDKADHARLARTLVDLTACPLAVPNYRLTTPHNPIQHPTHATDVLLFLHFLSTWPDVDAPLVLLGHSCSAHIIASILLASPFAELAPSPQLLAATQAVIFSEGIYDIDALLRSFPSYKAWFIANTFTERDAYPDVNVASYVLRPGAEHIRWLILHSTGDVLVDQLQSETMYLHLSALTAGETRAVRPIVDKSFDELEEGHNDLLKGDIYPRMVARFVAAQMGWMCKSDGYTP